jgi:hypothetical protein
MFTSRTKLAALQGSGQRLADFSELFEIKLADDDERRDAAAMVWRYAIWQSNMIGPACRAGGRLGERGRIPVQSSKGDNRRSSEGFLQLRGRCNETRR